MFFKRIEMTGFKSFATKTVVELKDGVTVKDYINAIIDESPESVNLLIKGYLSYRPAEPYDLPDYEKIAQTLISA